MLRLGMLVLCLATNAVAGVTVTQNLALGASSWPGTPIAATAANPSAQLTVGETFTAASSYGQTFTVTGADNYSLQSILIYAGGGSGANAASSVSIGLFDLGGRAAPNPGTYSAAWNLLGAGSGLQIDYTPQQAGLLRLDFTGADRAQLVAGHMYVFEIAGVRGTTPLNWYRTVADTYAGGAAYRNRSWINGTNARDFGLAIYGAVDTAPVPPTQCTVNGRITHQQIDGFGAGAVFLDAGLDPLTEATMDALYGTGPNQMGLTLLRVRISPTGDWNSSILDGQKASKRGARILATPWSPPASMKDNNNVANGGSLMPSQYANYVAWLNLFADRMSAAGAPVSVLSVQNEADFTATYESCRWSAAQFLSFFSDYAGGIKAPVMMPESFNFDQSLSDATLNDPAAAGNVSYIGGHLYGGTVQDYPLAHALGKNTWMTEYLINDQTIDSAIDTASQISDCLSVGNMSAYIWWKTIGNANGLLNASGELQRRAYVMGQFSRFIRPGDTRIDVSANTSPLNISAFRNGETGRFAIVAVNNTTLPVEQRFSLDGLPSTSVTPWITSATQSLELQPRLAVGAGAFTYVIPPLSVITFEASESRSHRTAGR